MKSYNNNYLNTLIVFFSAVLMSACTLGDISEELNSGELSPEEIEAASQIMGQALSDDNDGVFSSLNDALTTVSEDGFGAGDARFKNNHDDDDEDDDYSGRGGESNYEHEYDPETGIHTVSFNREVNAPNFQKSLSAILTYIFTDVNGEFIERPKSQKERIENIDFTANKTGTTQARFRNSEFSRADTFSITGVSDASSILTIDGKHYGNGNYKGVRGNGDTFERFYVNEINFLDIQINKDTVAYYGSMAQGVTGTLNYEMSIYKNNNGNESTKTVSGTIEMDGDGTALLRFQNLNKLFRVNLESGIVSDDDDDAELEAAVVSVDLQNQTVSLEGNIQVMISRRTEIEGDDGLKSLEDVARALENDLRVIAEVEGYRSPQNRSVFIADEIEFEFPDDEEDDDDDDDDD